MLPDYLVPAKYHITPVEQQPTEAVLFQQHITGFAGA